MSCHPWLRVVAPLLFFVVASPLCISYDHVGQMMMMMMMAFKETSRAKA
jgi:hypothetical protein